MRLNLSSIVNRGHISILAGITQPFNYGYPLSGGIHSFSYRLIGISRL